MLIYGVIIVRRRIWGLGREKPLQSKITQMIQKFLRFFGSSGMLLQNTAGHQRDGGKGIKNIFIAKHRCNDDEELRGGNA